MRRDIAQAPAARRTVRMPHDPGLASLRRATRAAIIIPTMFAFAKVVIGDLQVMTFVAFGGFALLVMADFGGPRLPRAAAYGMTTLVGSVLITIATLASSTPWAGAALMLLVGFSIQFAGLFGSYVAAAQTALLLSFVLSVSVPASSDAILPRLIGWLIAGTVATASGVFLWPRFERVQLRNSAASACRALAELIKAERRSQDESWLAQRQRAAQDAVEATRHDYSTTPKRPAGPARRDRAFVELLAQLERMLDFTTRPLRLELERTHPDLGEGDELAAAIVRTLEASADILTGGSPPDLEGLNEARLAHRAALDRWAAVALRTGISPEDVLAGLETDHNLRVNSYLAIAIGSNAIITAGGEVEDEALLTPGTPRGGAIRPLVRIARSIRTNLNPTSSVLHQSIRVGVGLALAVLLARELQLQHAFWVVLGTLSVLRSNAFGTGRTTLEALYGTMIGFAVGALATLLFGTASFVLWIALPVVVFVATYAAGTISFVAGQAAFTLLVIILFNLISPVGWRVGLVRIEDVGAGVAVSVVTGLLLWPRGARGELVATLAEFYRDVTAYLARSFDRILESGSPGLAAVERSRAIRARDRAGDAFDQFLHERGTKSLRPETAARLISAAADAIIVGDVLQMVEATGYRVESTADEETALRDQAQLMLAGLVGLADRLDGTASSLLSGTRVSDQALHDIDLAWLRRWKDDAADGRSAIAAIIASEWIRQLGDLTANLTEPVDLAVETARLPWWR